MDCANECNRVRWLANQIIVSLRIVSESSKSRVHLDCTCDFITLILALLFFLSRCFQLSTFVAVAFMLFLYLRLLLFNIIIIIIIITITIGLFE